MRLLILDLDGTLWDHEDASRLIPPYEFHSDYLVDPYGEELHLFPGVREFLEWASERFLLSIASWNIEEKVRPILEGFGLWGYFLFPKIEGHPDKADMIRRTIEELESIGYTIDDVIYVDDRAIHMDKIKMELPEVDFIHMWVDVKSFEELTTTPQKAGLR
ncbi:magnesium-dependent phosphatase-1 [Thermococcus peptonophilus]|uniref:Magnesium-dependent phosphatase-1 n=1 Tax=Thermococcus peptonophilus TaxID=53952 RepID=A0A142CUH7_9EURY|nr:magnesium-dependent phosphatase-1 [Thermococcus peptonophilus]AMQ18429.1 magnesium-dependent phosphatase-1 [Thermococcus peptonophilus]